MAKRTIHVLVDDLDGGDADETIRFGLDGVEYEIDLSHPNAAKLRDVFSRFIAAGSKVSGKASRVPVRQVRSGGSAGSDTDREHRARVREWAHANGVPVSERGRIAQDVYDKYRAAMT